MTDFISIDQNSSPLWDAIPKLQAAAAKGYAAVHCVEDVDIAFTQHGASPGEHDLSLRRERYYRGGTSDWGAAWFYSDFLGRLPLDVRELEPFTGWTTAALSRRLECSVDELYDRFSPSDNWQLVGTSYLGDTNHHRVIADISVKEVAPYLTALMEHARNDMLARFPEPDSRARTEAWFHAEGSRLQNLIRQHEGGSFTDLSKSWLAACCPPPVTPTQTSDVFGLTAEEPLGLEILETFIANYETAGKLYNQAIVETGVGLTPLNLARGELPAAVVFRDGNRWFRTNLQLRDEALQAGDRVWPLQADPIRRLPRAAMQRDGVVACIGKALLLVLQARLKPRGRSLLLPYQGSLYMPAAHAFESLLEQAGLLNAERNPICRVRFHFLERLKECRTLVRVPDHLAGIFAADELRACELAEEVDRCRREAHRDLSALSSKDERERLLANRFGDLIERRQGLDLQRRELAKAPETRNQAAMLWDEIKDLDRALLDRQAVWITSLIHVRNLDYYDSRGALLPWSLALGGQAFYEKILQEAEIYSE